jgi:hypothetical protein
MRSAIVGWLLLCAACAEPSAPAADGCSARAQSRDADPEAGSWRLLVPTHPAGHAVDAVLDGCAALVSLAHDPGPGGKIYQPGPAELLWSADGVAWTARDMATQAFFRSVAAGNGRWVAVGERTGRGVISVSTHADASGWREVFAHDAYFRSVAFGAGKFVAVAELGVAVSSDGESWHWSQLPAAPAIYSEVAFGAGRFVVAGVGMTLSSTDAEHWSMASCAGGCPAIQPPSGPASTTIALQQVHFAAGAFYAAGGSGQLRSQDGLTFEVYSGERVPDLALGGKLLSLVQTPGMAPHALAVSGDAGQSWRELPLTAASASADCAHHLCRVAQRSFLVFEPAR